ncbi:MAG: SPFH domain-containing protein [archaeon]
MACENLVRRIPFRTLGAIVNEGEKGFLVHSGKFVKEVGPGRYFLSPIEEIIAVDTTNKTESVQQQVISQEGYPVVYDAQVTYKAEDVKNVALNCQNLPNYVEQALKSELIRIKGESLENCLDKSSSKAIERLSAAGLKVLSLDVMITPQEPYAHYKLEEFKTVRIASIRLAEDKVGLDRARVEVERTKILQEKRLVEAKTDYELAKQRQELQLGQLEKSYDAFAKFAKSLKESYGEREARNVISTLFDPNIGQTNILPAANPWGCTYQVFRYKPRMESLQEMDEALTRKYGIP